MREIFRLVCYGDPVPQPRQDHRVAKNKQGAHYVQNYVDRNHPVQSYKEELRKAAREAGLPAKVIDQAVLIELTFYHPRPASLCRAKDPIGPILKGTLPDYDNLAKAAQDALTGLLWKDDARVAGYVGNSRKYYVELGGDPRTELAVFLP